MQIHLLKIMCSATLSREAVKPPKLIRHLEPHYNFLKANQLYDFKWSECSSYECSVYLQSLFKQMLDYSKTLVMIKLHLRGVEIDDKKHKSSISSKKTW